MDTYSALKNDLLNVNASIASLFSKTNSINDLSNQSYEDWDNSCTLIRRQLSEELIRVAVVGSIKSGKSTFVNAFLNGDHLKRGAGVVTSIVTKVRRGPSLRARLYFKTWDEVNSDMNQALILLPDFSLSGSNDTLDIRRSEDRASLESALTALSPDLLVSNGTCNANNILLQSYLKGYDRVREILSSDERTLVYGDDRFDEHRAFAGNDHLAVYLRDILLETNCDNLAEFIEVADCQGSDSPNPFHLAMIQDYLNLTHLTIYVVSSRTGIRQADIKFLSMIKQMGIIDNIQFVVNCDLNEHESLRDLEALIQKVKDDLSYLKPNPEVFTFSALLNLFRVEKEHLSSKDQHRLVQWEKDSELSQFSDNQTDAFMSAFQRKLNQERFALLLENQMHRMKVMVSEGKHWIAVNQEILTRGTDQIQELVNKIEAYQAQIGKIQSMVKNTLDGSLGRLKGELKKDIDRLFDQKPEGVVEQINNFIAHCDLQVETYRTKLAESGFNHTMYLVYQGFKQLLDEFMANKVNPQVLRFVRDEEEKIGQYLSTILEPYDVMIQDALSEFNQNLSEIGIATLEKTNQTIERPNVEAVKSIAGLELPPAVATLRYSAKIKTEAILRLGVYTVVHIFKRMLKKPIQDDAGRQFDALKDGGRRMKNETEKSIRFHMRDHKENIKFQYLCRLADAMAGALKELLVSRFQAHAENLLNMVDEIRSQKLDKERVTEVLQQMEQQASEIDDNITNIQDRMTSADMENGKLYAVK
jgi:GTPase SAR1 family protein